MENRMYRFYWDCGRSGHLEGIFVCTEERLNRAIGEDLYFGEALGKHSEIYGPLEKGDISLITDDQDFINKAINYRLIPTGYNPLNYIRNEEDEEYDC